MSVKNEQRKSGIDWKHVLFQRVLNLPEPKAEERKALESMPGEVIPPEVSNPWKNAVETPAPAQTSAPVTTATGVLWSPAQGSVSAKVWRRIGRTGLFAVVGLLAWAGLRTTLFPELPPQPAPLPAAVTFDAQSASGVATRLTLTALTWNEDDAEARAAGIALDYQGGKNDLGWNRKGRQVVTSAIPSTVAVADDGKSARVTVFTLVTRYTRANTEDPWAVTASEWLTTEVPVTQDGSRMVATAGPSLTGRSAPARPPAPAPTQQDTLLTDSTRDMARAFFADYGTGDVSAVEAPGARIAALASSWRLKDVTAWTVHTGTGDTRQATAAVTWIAAEQKATLTQSYTVTLTTVSGAGVGRWQVSAIHSS